VKNQARARAAFEKAAAFARSGLGESLAALAEAYDYEKVLALLPASDTVKAEADT
jgi:hypothetical protein